MIARSVAMRQIDALARNMPHPGHDVQAAYEKLRKAAFEL
jgi:hypothetical protein